MNRKSGSGFCFDRLDPHGGVATRCPNRSLESEGSTQIVRRINMRAGEVRRFGPFTVHRVEFGFICKQQGKKECMCTRPELCSRIVDEVEVD